MSTYGETKVEILPSEGETVKRGVVGTWSGGEGNGQNEERWPGSVFYDISPNFRWRFWAFVLHWEVIISSAKSRLSMNFCEGGVFQFAAVWALLSSD
ncbi:hypothetical protein MRB53_005565 [Persea americana]|uniref:Uncharacterized protein n=1 Tax=Persea americana TaxID=3435 RepID=A0ACC2MF82_PERAE|nr:hypothetical protein MRB53_005565 [Persea americana]